MASIRQRRVPVLRPKSPLVLPEVTEPVRLHLGEGVHQELLEERMASGNDVEEVRSVPKMECVSIRSLLYAAGASFPGTILRSLAGAGRSKADHSSGGFH